MDKDKDTELKEKILREILCKYMEEIDIDTEISCNSHFTSAIREGIEEGMKAGRREVLEELKKSEKPFDWISGGCDEEACKKEWCRYLEELIKQKQEKEEKSEVQDEKSKM